MTLLLFSLLVSMLNTEIERRPVLLCSVHLKQLHDESALHIRSRSNAARNLTKYLVFLTPVIGLQIGQAESSRSAALFVL